MKVTLALCLAATASAFVPAAHTVSARSRAAERTVPSMALEDMIGIGPETNNKVFDPAGLAKMGSDKTLAWYRACELKHGRVAMLATGGWMVQSLGCARARARSGCGGAGARARRAETLYS